MRDAVRCDDETWYIAGAVYADESRPALWRGESGATDGWAVQGFAARWYWARRNVLTSVTCRDSRVALLGAKEGGAHGNPRVSTWRRRADGVFEDVLAGMDLYGGWGAVNVGRLTAGPQGYLISGNRMTGAAAWTSPDAEEFTLHDSDPALAKNEQVTPLALDAAWTGSGWTMVGSGQRGKRRIPMAWVSPDGRHWDQQEVPSDDAEFTDLQRVVATDQGVVAAGIRGDTFGLWRRTEDTWAPLGRFGNIAAEARAVIGVSGLIVTSAGILATVTDGARYSLWFSSDFGTSWREVRTPTVPTTAGEHVLTIEADGDEVLLLAGDAEAGRAWWGNAADLD